MALRSITQIDIEALDDDSDGVVYLTREQARIRFDQEARKKLGISGEELLRRLDAGEYTEAINLPGDIGMLEMFSHVVR
jgi:hypothetical protein